MWIAKGILLGLWLFGFATMAWLWFEAYRHLPPGQGAISVDLLLFLTVRSTLWWTALVLCFAVGLWILRSWAVPLGVWIAVLIIGLVPAGFLALFIVLYVALKRQMAS